MSYKNLLVHVDHQPSCEARLDAALALARAHEAHLAALCLIAQPFVPPAVGIEIPSSVIEKQREEALKSARELVSRVEATATKADVPIETRYEVSLSDSWSDSFARHARHADLSIVGQPKPSEGDPNAEIIAHASFMNSGRPALIIPWIGTQNMPPKNVLVAWDGSREAARAVNDSLPMLTAARTVWVVTIDAGKLGTRLGQSPGIDVATHLARHGIRVELKALHGDGMSVGEVLLNEVMDSGADLIVMGGYGHSRLRELVLGGATRFMLAHMTVPLLMAH